jgi:glutaredoxin 3
MTASRSNSPPITIYTTEPCSFCARVKGLLSAKGLEFSEVNLSKDPAGRVELASRTGMMTFPQVLVGDRLLGGFAETLSALQDGRLEELLAAQP